MQDTISDTRTAAVPVSLADGDAFGTLVRRLRGAKGLTLGKTAAAAGVGRVTLSRWESGAQRPRMRELEALLGALGAGAGDRRRAMSLLDTTRAHAVVREEVARIKKHLGLGPLPSGADLLRAIRLRRGLSVEEAAGRIGVSGRTVRRWERGEVWPPLDRLHAFCHVLGAREAEVIALTVGDFARAPLGAEDATDPRDLWERVVCLHYRVVRGEEPLMELRYLPLTAQAWGMAARTETGRDVLRLAYHCRGMGLENLGDRGGSRRMAERVLELGPGADQARPRKSWVYSGVIMAMSHLATGQVTGARQGWEILRPLPEMTPLPYMKAWIFSVMADCLAAMGADDQALALGEESVRISEGSDVEREESRRDQARRLVIQGRHGEALDLLDGWFHHDVPLARARSFLCRAEALAGLGERAAADASLQSAYEIIGLMEASHLRLRADRAASRMTR